MASTRNRYGSRKLTPRNLQLIELVTEGLRNVDIAERMGISTNSVKLYLQRVFDKTGFSNRTELAVWYMKMKNEGAI